MMGQTIEARLHVAISRDLYWPIRDNTLFKSNYQNLHIQDFITNGHLTEREVYTKVSMATTWI